MRLSTHLISLAAVLILAATAQAALLGYEGFAGYTVGSNLLGQAGTGNSGLVGTWSGTGHLAQADSLSYTNGGTLVTSGGSLRSTANVNVFRDLSTPVPTTTATGQEFWMSYLFKSGSTLVDDNLVRFYVKTDPGLNGNPSANGRGVGIDTRLAEGSNPDPTQQLVATRLWFYQVIQTDSAPLFKPPGEINLLLLQYVLDDANTTGNQGVVRAWVNPAIGGAAPSIASAVAVKADLGAWPSPDRLGFFSLGSGDSAVTWDELRWGDSFADVTPVVPEPATSGLIAIAWGGLLVLRRRS